MPDLSSLHIPQSGGGPKKKKKKQISIMPMNGANFATFSTANASISDIPGYIVYRDKFLFPEGDFPDKQFSITGDELATQAAITEQVPLDHAHSSPVCRGPLDGKFGFARNFTVKDRNGKRALFGDIYVDDRIHPLLSTGETNLSCTWTRTDKRLHNIALVTDPRIEDAVLMAAFAQARSAPEKGTMNPKLMQDLLAAFKRGEITDAQLAVFMGAPAGSAPAGQTKDVNQGVVNDGTGPNPSGGQPAGGKPFKKKKGKASVVMGSIAGAPTANMSKDTNDEIAQLKRKLAEFENKAHVSQTETLLAEIRSATAAFSNKQKEVEMAQFSGEITELANSMKFSPAQITEFRRIAAAQPAAFAQMLPVLQQSLPNPAVVGFASDAIPASLMNSTVDAAEIAAEFSSERPDIDLAAFSRKIYNDAAASGRPMSMGEAFVEAGRRHPALVLARQQKTPVLG